MTIKKQLFIFTCFSFLTIFFMNLAQAYVYRFFNITGEDISFEIPYYEVVPEKKYKMPPACEGKEPIRVTLLKNGQYYDFSAIDYTSSCYPAPFAIKIYDKDNLNLEKDDIGGLGRHVEREERLKTQLGETWIFSKNPMDFRKISIAFFDGLFDKEQALIESRKIATMLKAFPVVADEAFKQTKLFNKIQSLSTIINFVTITDKMADNSNYELIAEDINDGTYLFRIKLTTKKDRFSTLLIGKVLDKEEVFIDPKKLSIYLNQIEKKYKNFTEKNNRNICQ